MEMAGQRDILSRVWSNDRAAVGMVGAVGRGRGDRLPGMRRAFMRQAAGFDPNEPRLLRGEAI